MMAVTVIPHSLRPGQLVRLARTPGEAPAPGFDWNGYLHDVYDLAGKQAKAIPKGAVGLFVGISSLATPDAEGHWNNGWLVLFDETLVTVGKGLVVDAMEADEEETNATALGA